MIAGQWKERQIQLLILKKFCRRQFVCFPTIISAQQIWLNRITGTHSKITPWDNYTIDEAISKSAELTSKWINLLEGNEQTFLEKRIQYQNSKGETFTNSIKDIVTHVINHATYHRAQIAHHVKHANGTPAITDYIVYQREFQK